MLVIVITEDNWLQAAQPVPGAGYVYNKTECVGTPVHNKGQPLFLILLAHFETFSAADPSLSWVSCWLRYHSAGMPSLPAASERMAICWCLRFCWALCCPDLRLAVSLHALVPQTH